MRTISFIVPVCAAMSLTTFTQTSFASGEKKLTLSELQAELKSHPEAQWTPVSAEAFEKKEGLQTDHRLGLQVDSELENSQREWGLDQSVTPAGLPSHIDWRDKDGANWLSPIQNQGRCGSCVAFAVVGAFEANLNIANANPQLNINLSEQNLFENTGSCGMGTTEGTATNYLKRAGVPDEACEPYTFGRLGESKKTKACVDVSARKIVPEDVKHIRGADIKEALQHGPVVTAMTVFEDFDFYKSGVYKHVSGKRLGGHMVVIVGYDDAQGAFIARNSWDTTWGENGYFRIAYNDASGFANSGSLVVAPKLVKEIKPQFPIEWPALAGQALIPVANLSGKEQARLSYSLMNEKGEKVVTSAEIPATQLQASFDTTMVANGQYQLVLESENNAGQKSVWYSQISVANGEQNLGIEATLEKDMFPPLFSAREPALTFRTHFLQTPPTEVIVEIRSKDGSFQKTSRIQNPGSLSQLGWHPDLMPEGVFEIVATAKIGDLFSSKSNTLVIDTTKKH